ncbi:DUF4157 domain-containing protein [Amycolatopsis sp. OK19-0408]|uniref:DUF4157 domain-containing protein n=1 Tax=Amycolatopsis iheyensis TaxID=2945988 RepID=A0A9X2SNA1_9PSEU|nr:DUF4157 domain-containing protein [Amycolatopsis iheyensis]MCR6487823.1 DUF4157 domain-containing protein [Amycolatopsis iheyensis]
MEPAIAVAGPPQPEHHSEPGRVTGLATLAEPSSAAEEPVATPPQPPLVLRHAPAVPAAVSRPVLTTVTPTSVGEPVEPAQPFRSVTEVERIFAEYQANDVAGLAALTGFTSVADPPPATPAPEPQPEVRRLRRPTLGQARRLARTANPDREQATGENTPAPPGPAENHAIADHGGPTTPDTDAVSAAPIPTGLLTTPPASLSANKPATPQPDHTTDTVPGTIAATFRTQFGVDVADVPVRRGRAVSAQAATLSARAFTTAGEVFLPDEADALTTVDAGGLLVHELTHVAQQRLLGPAVPPEASADGAELERRALAAEQWARGENAPPDALVPETMTAEAGQPPEVMRAEAVSWSLPSEAPAEAPDDSELVARLDRLDETVAELAKQDREPAEALADRLYHRLRHRLRGELLVDRERRGTLADRW